jgi:hypothetical protein
MIWIVPGMVKVFFNPDYTQTALATDVKIEDLVFIADIATHELKAALDIGQNDDQPWTRHPLVTPAEGVREGTRSIATGDVLQLDGEWFMVMALGFEKI